MTQIIRFLNEKMSSLKKTIRDFYFQIVTIKERDPSNPNSFSFYWPVAQRAKVDEMLKRASDGSFCLRRSRDKNLCLSIKHHKGKRRHLNTQSD